MYPTKAPMGSENVEEDSWSEEGNRTITCIPKQLQSQQKSRKQDKNILPKTKTQTEGTTIQGKIKDTHRKP